MTVPARVLGLSVGAALVAAAVSGRAELLVRPWFVPIIAAAGVLLAAASLRSTRRVPASTAFALLLPVAVGLTLTPSLVARAAHSNADLSTLSSRVGDPANPLLHGRGGNVTLLQILVAEQQGGGVALAGRPVTVEAFADGPHRLARSVIVCCAADAQTVALPETGPSLPRRGTWVRVHGVLSSEGETTVLTASSVSVIPTPANPFL